MAFTDTGSHFDKILMEIVFPIVEQAILLGCLDFV